jgi:ABC-type antimicrobial peptide transport system permease subunit
VRKADPQIAVNFEFVRDVVASTISRQQLGMTLMLIFGVVAVLLAAIGIYGVVAYGVSQRRDEMATRLALGATPTSVFWLVMKQGGLLAAIGTVIGLATAYLSGQIVANQVYAVRASDPLMLTAAIVVVGGIRGAGDDAAGRGGRRNSVPHAPFTLSRRIVSAPEAATVSQP